MAYWNNDVIFMTFSSLATPAILKNTDQACDENFLKITYPFQRGFLHKTQSLEPMMNCY